MVMLPAEAWTDLLNVPSEADATLLFDNSCGESHSLGDMVTGRNGGARDFLGDPIVDNARFDYYRTTHPPSVLTRAAPTRRRLNFHGTHPGKWPKMRKPPPF